MQFPERNHQRDSYGKMELHKSIFYFGACLSRVANMFTIPEEMIQFD